MLSLFILLALVAQVLAAPTPAQPERRAVQPKVKSSTYVGNVTDPSVSRDSCGSVRIDNRVLWTCRDTTKYDVLQQKSTLPMVTNTASWTNLTSEGGPELHNGPVGAASSGTSPILQMYGDIYNASGMLNEFFPLQQSQCPDYGVCEDGSRWVVWPDSPPLIASSSDSSTIGYTWIPNVHLANLTQLNSATPSHALYKTSYASSSDLNVLPTTQLISPGFCEEGEIGYGRYGNVAKDNYAYLYGQTASKTTALARVPLSSIEDRSTYQYYVNNAWSSTPPSISSASATVPNAGAGGQGTFYYCSYLTSYVWIGQQANSVVADFYITTSPAPEGPWTVPVKFFEGQNGDGGIGGYSLQAHPSLSNDGGKRGIHVSWTQYWKVETVAAGYITPLVWLEFEGMNQ
ncbi:hypothetical protein DOTSEDRAFT_91245 [Dothistroma septosporum NZE10]|uniref:DUF4185 domain-containing protein n=1 Tax=Dothistroma septosporum (strain NZE10 / CBS 128990) TaxID=675120 RepID=N1PF26_DOTSN|nr:hypothetical protein DOTSEDRAFT_91245 [Dothistroma septosporum NZE10]